MDTSTRRRQLQWRSKRGLLELELLLAPFVESSLGELSRADLDLYGRLLEHDDLDLYDWLRGVSQTGDPSLQPIIDRIIALHTH